MSTDSDAGRTLYADRLGGRIESGRDRGLCELLPLGDTPIGGIIHRDLG